MRKKTACRLCGKTMKTENGYLWHLANVHKLSPSEIAGTLRGRDDAMSPTPSRGELPVGCFVAVSQNDLGIGKLIETMGSKARVEWFKSVSTRELQEVDIGDLKRVRPSRQTRCYVTDEYESGWEMGRITGQIDSEASRTGIEYDIDFTGRHSGYVKEEYVFVRCLAPSVDPTQTLICFAQDTPFFHDRRSGFLTSIIEQRASAHGLSGLLSSRIRLYPHQIEVARRVLEDPVQRYLLADEVGLGKTIEAGIILRQILLDNPASRVLVLVPPELLAQWRRELRDRFLINPESEFMTLCSMDAIHQVRPTDKFDVVVIDEAQHVAEAMLHESHSVLWESCRMLAHHSPRLLLLSATPALHYEEEFLAILHLMDPETYHLDDVEAFRQRVAARQPVGELLLLLREGMHRTPMRQCLDDLAQLLNGDKWAMDHVNALRVYCDKDAPSADDKATADVHIRALRVHICETYRIYRRMLRSARAYLPPETLAPRASDPDEPLILEECEYDDRLEAILGKLEEWRASAAEASWLAEDAECDSIRSGLAEVFHILLEYSGTWLRMLTWAIECRLGRAKALSKYEKKLSGATAKALATTPLFKGEEGILLALMKESTFQEPAYDQFDTLAHLVGECHSKGLLRCVIFASHTLAGREIVVQLRKRATEVDVVSHLEDDSTDLKDEGIERFRTSTRPIVLVCDRSGEEGLNLQFADVLVHFDLPWDPNRIEQRIGRLDRIGRSAEVRSGVLLASDEKEASLQVTWYHILKEGFRIFSQSIADLRFLTSRLMPEIKIKAFLDGIPGVLEQLPTIRDEIESERKLLREQTSLDEIEALDDECLDFRKRLLECDNRHEHLEKALDSWAQEALLLRRDEKRYGSRPQHNHEGSTTSSPLVRYEPTWHSLMPTETAIRIRLSQLGYASFSRSRACSEPGVEVLRIGHPFVQALVDYLLWDDRGQAFAIWRIHPPLRTDDALIYFQLDYVLETNLHPAEEVLASLGWDPAVMALSRRADAWLPPQRRILNVDEALQIATDAETVELLMQPYRPHKIGGPDYGLGPDRQYALEKIISLDRWAELCREVRSLSEQTIRSDESLSSYCRSSVELAQHDLDRRMEQVRSGLIFRTGIGTLDKNATEIGTIVEKERRLYNAVIEGIKHPTVKLDAVGLIVVSGHSPFAD